MVVIVLSEKKKEQNRNEEGGISAIQFLECGDRKRFEDWVVIIIVIRVSGKPK